MFLYPISLNNFMKPFKIAQTKTFESRQDYPKNLFTVKL